MSLELNPKLIGALLLIPAVVQFLKMWIPGLATEKWKRLLPPINFILALLASWMFLDAQPKVIVLNAVLLTLSVMGLWSGGKAAIGK